MGFDLAKAQIGKQVAPCLAEPLMESRRGMKKQKAREDFWLVLGLINLLAMVYPVSSYLLADGMDQVLWVCVLIGIGLVLAIVEKVSIVVAYLQ